MSMRAECAPISIVAINLFSGFRDISDIALSARQNGRSDRDRIIAIGAEADFDFGRRNAEQMGFKALPEYRQDCVTHGCDDSSAEHNALRRDDRTGRCRGNTEHDGAFVYDIPYDGVSRVIIKKGGRRCGCGHKGCIEAYCSKIAYVKAIKKEIRKRALATLLPTDKFNLKSTNIKSKYLARAYAAGDPEWYSLRVPRSPSLPR